MGFGQRHDGFRVLGAAGAALLMLAAAPASAQQFSDSYNFLNAIRETDGTKVNKFLERQVAADRQCQGPQYRRRRAAHRGSAFSDSTLSARAAPAATTSIVNLQDGRGNTALIIAAERGWE
jgi:hypothetical protein